MSEGGASYWSEVVMEGATRSPHFHITKEASYILVKLRDGSLSFVSQQ